MTNNSRIIITEDGSHTLYNEEVGDHYHSLHGSYTESAHVYIRSGLHECIIDGRKSLNILEYGFGTGLNVALSWLAAKEFGLEISYQAIEKFPLAKEVYSQLNYPQQLGIPGEIFLKFHETEWNKESQIDATFSLKKIQADFREHLPESDTNLVFYDAFSPSKQPELWSKEIFQRLFPAMNPGGIFVTYSSQGNLRRNLQEAGFHCEKILGPPGKREMTRAVKR